MIGLIAVVAMWGFAISAGIYALEKRLAKIEKKQEEIMQELERQNDTNDWRWRAS